VKWQLFLEAAVGGLSGQYTGACDAPISGHRVYFSNERMIVILLVGALAVYLSSKVVRGADFGRVGDGCVSRTGFCLGLILISQEASSVWPSTRRSGQLCCCWYWPRLARADGARLAD
jgi:hypothetical protein